MKQALPRSRIPKSRYGIESLARGLATLALFSSDAPSLSFTEIVETLKLHKSTAFRVLSTLETAGYLERDAATRRYRPGLKVLQLGFTALSSLEVRQIARPYLERVALELNETASLAVLDGLHIIYVDRIRNRAIVGVVLGVGSQVPAHSTSLGKVLLADLPAGEIKKRLAGVELARYTPHTIVDRSALLAELALIRKRGYAINDEELAIGLRGVSAPIRDATRRAVAAINVSGPTATISRERLKSEIMPAVVKTAGQISLALGYSHGNSFQSTS